MHTWKEYGFYSDNDESIRYEVNPTHTIERTVEDNSHKIYHTFMLDSDVVSVCVMYKDGSGVEYVRQD